MLSSHNCPYQTMTRFEIRLIIAIDIYGRVDCLNRKIIISKLRANFLISTVNAKCQRTITSNCRIDIYWTFNSFVILYFHNIKSSIEKRLINQIFLFILFIFTILNKFSSYKLCTKNFIETENDNNSGFTTISILMRWIFNSLFCKKSTCKSSLLNHIHFSN